MKRGFDLNDHPSYCCHASIDEQFMSFKLMEILYKRNYILQILSHIMVLSFSLSATMSF
jgi:hypothetical protein